MGATLGTDLVIRKESEASIDLWNLPWQHLKKALTEWCIVTRSKHAAKDRTHLQQVDEIDAHITKKIISCLGDKERKVYSHISGRGLVRSSPAGYWHLSREMHALRTDPGGHLSCHVAVPSHPQARAIPRAPRRRPQYVAKIHPTWCSQSHDH